MNWLLDMLREPAVYWAPGTIDRFGKPGGFADPIEIKCHWEDKAEEYIKPGGQTATSSARVQVDRDLELTGRLWQGALDDAPSDPFKGFEIQQKHYIKGLTDDSPTMREVIL